MGDHRLVCGSATSEVSHAKAINGEKIDAVAIDPPYGVGIDYGPHYQDSEESLVKLIEDFMPLVLKWPVVAISTGTMHLWKYPKPTWLLGWSLSRGTGQGPWGFTCYHPIPVWGKDPYLAERLGGRPDTAAELSADREGFTGHPTVKPVAWWKWLIERITTVPGRHVLDCFCGSGTTIICAEMTGRIAHAIELSPSFVDVSVMRWQDFTGKEAVLEQSGQTFAKEKEHRLAVSAPKTTKGLRSPKKEASL